MLYKILSCIIICILFHDSWIYVYSTKTYGVIGFGYAESNYLLFKKTKGEFTETFFNTSVESVGVGDGFSFAKLDDGQVYTWGKNLDSQLGRGFSSDIASTDVVNDIRVSQICAGKSHVIVLTTNSKLYSWGSGVNSELGQIGVSSRSSPGPVDMTNIGQKTITKIACGRFHTLALTSEGEIFCWGRNVNRQCGRSGNVFIPTKINSAADTAGTEVWTDIAAGGAHSLATATAVLGTTTYTQLPFAWGSQNQVGSVTSSDIADPKTLHASNPSSFSRSLPTYSISSSLVASAIVQNGKVLTFGQNTNGVLGRPNAGTNQFPVFINSQELNNAHFVKIFSNCNSYHVFALDNLGNVFSWGYNHEFQLGHSPSVTSVFIPQLSTVPGIPRERRILNIETNELSSIFATDDGNVFQIGKFMTPFYTSHKPMFGYANEELFLDSYVPENVDIGISMEHGLLIDNELELYSWGVNRESNLLGLGENIESSHLFRRINVSENLNSTTIPKIVSPGDIFSIVQSSLGTLLSWGDGQQGSLGVGTTESSSKPIAVNLDSIPAPIKFLCSSAKYSIALATNGKMYSWGSSGGTSVLGVIDDDNIAEQILFLPTPIKTENSGVFPSAIGNNLIVNVACGRTHALSCDESGNVYAWGRNDALQLGSNAGNVAPVPILVHSDVPSALNGKIIVDLAVGDDHSVALSNDGFLFSWGSNEFGQLGNETIIDGTYIPTLVSVKDTPLQEKEIIEIQAGSHHTVVLSSDGLLFSWGRNNFGQLGNLHYDNTPFPLPVLGGDGNTLRDVQSYSVYNTYTVAVVLHPEPICFGMDPTETCSRRGVCSSQNNCTCFEGYFGTECGSRFCFGLTNSDPNVCNGVGICREFNQCSCSKEFWGDQCQFHVCYGKGSGQCNSVGTCVSLDTCECPEGKWVGKECDIPICYDILANDTSVCNSLGNCTAPDTCSCISTYQGVQCETPICFGTPATESETCSGHGECVRGDNCTCVDGFGGSNCENFVCFGLLADNPEVCSSFGSCTGPNRCICEPNRSGADCSYPICFGIDGDADEVCSNRGECVSSNQCNCIPGYQGSQCEEITDLSRACFGFAHTDPRVCSGNGQCANLDTCVCLSNSGGIQCQHVFPPNLTFSNGGDYLYSDSFQYARSLNVIPCSTLFDADSLESIGQNSLCTWTDSGRFQLFTGFSATVMPGDRLNFVTGDSSPVKYIVDILPPLKPLQPIARLETLHHVIGRCQRLSLDGSKSMSFDSRALSFSFGSDVIDNVVNSLSEPLIVIEEEDIPLGTIQFNLIVRNFLNIASNSTTLSVKKIDKIVPVLTILGSDFVWVVPGEPFSIQGRVDPSCSGENINGLTFFWRQIDGPKLESISSTSQRLNFENGLPSEGFYEFEWIAQIPDVADEFVALVRVHCQFSSLVPLIKGGDRSVPTNRELIVDGSMSFDPDEGKVSLSYSYEWECTDLVLLAECPFTLESIAKPIIPANQLQNEHRYKITLRYASGNRTESTSVELLAKSDLKLMVTLDPIVPRFNSHQKLLLSASLEIEIDGKWNDVSGPKDDFNFVWTQQQLPVSSDLLLTPLDQAAILFKPFTLSPGGKYVFELQCSSNDDVASFSRVSTKINIPPRPGILNHNPESGESQSMMFFSTSQWKDSDLPIRYQYFFRSTQTQDYLPISPLSLSAIKSLSIPLISFENQELELGVEVVDFLGAFNRIQKTMSLKSNQPDRKSVLNAVSDVLKDVKNSNDDLISDVLRLILVLSESLYSREERYCKNDCSNHGECLSDYQRSFCKCELNYYGLDCSSSQEVKELAQLVKGDLILFLKESLSSHENDLQLEDISTLLKILKILSFDSDELDPEALKEIFTIINRYVRREDIGESNLEIIMEVLSQIDEAIKTKSFSRCDVLDASEYLQILRFIQLILTRLHIQGQQPTLIMKRFIQSYTFKDYPAKLKKHHAKTSHLLGGPFGDLSHSIMVPPTEFVPDEDILLTLTFNSFAENPFPCTEIQGSLVSLVMEIKFFQEENQFEVKDLSEPIELRFPGSFSYEDPSIYSCKYYDPSLKWWSEDGCDLVQLNRTSAICHCSHTSYFAIFQDPPSRIDWEVILLVSLGAFGLVLCCLILLFCLVCLVCLSFCCIIKRKKRSIKPDDDLFGWEKDQNIELHPWEKEHRGLPYYMRKYKEGDFAKKEYHGSDEEVEESDYIFTTSRQKQKEQKKQEVSIDPNRPQAASEEGEGSEFEETPIEKFDLDDDHVHLQSKHDEKGLTIDTVTSQN